MEDSDCFYAHENNTLLDRSKLVCTKDDLTKLKNILNKTDLIESRSREKLSTKWIFNKLTTLTVFAASLKDVLIGCKGAALAKTLLKNHAVNCLIFEKSYKTTIKRQLVLSSCLYFSFARKSKTGRRNIEYFQFFHERNGWTHPSSVSGSPYERYSSLGGPSAPERFALSKRHCGWEIYR